MTRHFNHSGYKILNKLIQIKANIVAVVLKDEFSWYNVPCSRRIAKYLYAMECRYYRCKPLKNTNSEEYLTRKSGLRIIKCRSMKSESFLRTLESIHPDLILLGGGWHELIPERVFSYPPMGCINTHPSLLPLFRGTSITRWQILHGVKESGSTIHYVDGSFDTGKIIAQAAIKVNNEETPQELFEKLGDLGAEMIPGVLQQLATKALEHRNIGRDQNMQSRYFSKWKWHEGELRIDWDRPLADIGRFIKANTQESYRYLGPYFTAAGKRYFLRECSVQPAINIPSSKGTIHVISRNEQFILSRAGEDVSLVMKRIQRFSSNYRLCRSYRPGQLIEPLDISFTGEYS